MSYQVLSSMDVDMLPATDTSWFTEFMGMEEAMAEQDFIRDCLADNQNVEDMAAINNLEDEFFFVDSDQSLSSSPKCNPATSTPAVIAQRKPDDTFSLSVSSNNSSSSRYGGNRKSSHNNRNINKAEPTQKSPTQNETSSDSDPKGVTNQKHERPPKSKTGRRKENYDHIIAERQRRQHLTQCFIALSALVPDLKRMDKASILVEAIAHMKELKGRLKKLEESDKCKRSEAESSTSAMPLKRARVPEPERVTRSMSSSSLKHEKYVLATTCTDEQRLEIEAQFIEKHVVIKVFCKKQKGVLMKIIAHIEDLHLSVITTNAIPFQDSNFDITIVAQVESEFEMRPQSFVKSLQSLFQ